MLFRFLVVLAVGSVVMGTADFFERVVGRLVLYWLRDVPEVEDPKHGDLGRWE